MDHPKSHTLMMFCVKEGYFVEEDVLRLDVTMDDVTVVHELYRMAGLLYHRSRLLLRETALGTKGVVHISPAAQLQYEIKRFLVGEEGVELDDVGVVEVALNLDLPHQLVDESLFSLEDAFGDLLECAEEVGGLVSK